MVEKKRNPYSYVLRVGRDHPRHDWKKVIMLFWHNIWVNKFIAPRDMYKNTRFIVPDRKIIKDVWIHNLSIGPLKKEILEAPMQTNEVPILVHAPTNKGVKGTAYIEAAIENLKNKGIKLEYRRIEKVPNKKAQEIYKKADIIIDQLMIGTYGSLAVEAMYYGKPVICNVCDDVRNMLDNCPVYNANVENIEEKIFELVTNKDLRVELGLKGREYVSKYHNKNIVCDQMCEIYHQLMN